MKLSVKLISGFVVIALLVGIVGFFGITSLKTIQENNETTTDIFELRNLLEVALVQVLQLIETENLKDYARHKSDFESTRVQFDALYEQHRKFIRDLGVESFDDDIDDFTQISNAIIAVHEKKLAKVREFEEKKEIGRPEQELEEIAAEQKKIDVREHLAIEELRELINLLEENEKRVVSTLLLKSESVGRNATATLFIVIAIAFIVAVVLGLYIARSISRPVVSLSRVAQSIAGGDLDKRAEVTSKDEIGQLAKAFNTMTDSLLEARRLPENILRSMKDSLFVLNTEGNITEINKAALDTLRYKKEELVGKSIDAVFVRTGAKTKTKKSST